MKRLLITTGMLLAVLACGSKSLVVASPATTAAKQPQFEASVRNYCMKAQAWRGFSYFARHGAPCRNRLRLLA